MHFWRHFDVIGSIILGGLHFWSHWFNMAKILSKFGEQQLVMVNYACGFNQSETGKHFEWIIMTTIIHQTHYEKSHWSRAFNQFTIVCKLDMINAISVAYIAFIMSSLTSAWLLSPLECSPQKQNGWTLRFCFWGWIMGKMYNKQLLNSIFAWYHELSKPRVCVNSDIGCDNSWYHAQPHPIIV